MVAWIALVLSGLLALAQFYGWWSRRRSADPVVWFERHGDEHYCVVHNQGNADGTITSLSFQLPDSRPVELALADRWPIPLPPLAGGDMVYLLFERSPGTWWVLTVDVEWTDRRGTHAMRRCTTVRPIVTKTQTTPASMRRAGLDW